MNPPLPPNWKCARRVGFLFPHECQRTSPEGCPDCQNGAIDDPYRTCGNRYGYAVAVLANESDGLGLEEVALAAFEHGPKFVSEVCFITGTERNQPNAGASSRSPHQEPHASVGLWI